MYCKKCGNLLAAEDKFCKICGQPIEHTTSSDRPLGVNNQQQAPNMFQTVQQPAQSNSFSTQNYQNPNHGQTYTKKSSNPILFGIIGILCVGLIVFAVLFFIQKNDKSELSDVTNNDSDQVAIADTTKVNYSGYTFSIPVEFITEKDVFLLVYDDTKEWISKIGVNYDITYTDIKNGMNQLKANMESAGILVNSIQEKSTNGNNWVIIEFTDEGYNGLGGYGKLANNNVVLLEILTADNTYDINKFSEFEKICSSAKVSRNKGITTSTTNKGILIDLAATLK